MNQKQQNKLDKMQKILDGFDSEEPRSTFDVSDITGIKFRTVQNYVSKSIKKYLRYVSTHDKRKYYVKVKDVYELEFNDPEEGKKEFKFVPFGSMPVVIEHNIPTKLQHCVRQHSA